VIELLPRSAGAVLGGVFGTVARLRPTSSKALHPRGHVTTGTLVRHGATPPTGVAWLDEPGTDDVLVRRSRSVGLPGALPDIHGLAVRVPVGRTRGADLLLASTGTRPGARHLLAPTRSDDHPLTTLLPYRTPSGPVLLGAFPEPGAAVYELRVAGLTGAWRPFGALAVDEPPTGGADEAPDVEVHFDPVLNPLPGLPSYGWVTRLREPAYAASRRQGRR
jgi:hypothetical protein